ALADLVLAVDGEARLLEHLREQLGDDLVGVVGLGADGERARGGLAAAVGAGGAGAAVLLLEGGGAAAGRGAEGEPARSEGAQQVTAGAVDAHEGSPGVGRTAGGSS